MRDSWKHSLSDSVRGSLKDSLDVLPVLWRYVVGLCVDVLPVPASWVDVLPVLGSRAEVMPVYVW